MILYRIDANVKWFMAHDPQDGLWIAVCPSLNLNADGTTREELDSCIAEVVHLLFTDLHENGEFDQFLTDQGWTAKREIRETLGGGPTFRAPFQVTQRENVEDLMARA